MPWNWTVVSGYDSLNVCTVYTCILGQKFHRNHGSVVFRVGSSLSISDMSRAEYGKLHSLQNWIFMRFKCYIPVIETFNLVSVYKRNSQYNSFAQKCWNWFLCLEEKLEMLKTQCRARNVQKLREKDKQSYCLCWNVQKCFFWRNVPKRFGTDGVPRDV